MRRGLGAAAAAVVVALAATPRVSAAPSSVTGSISVAMSTGNANPPLLSGDFQTDDPNAAISVTVTMSWAGPDPTHHPAKSSPQRVCPGTQCTTTSSGVHIDRFPLPAAAYNGPYHVDAAATATNPNPPILGGGSANGTAGADFSVAVPPPNVTGVTATANKDRSVSVSFDRDAVSPDVQEYWLYRKGPGDKNFTAVARTLQLSTGARINTSDTTGPQSKGGDYLYQVEEHRNGASGDNTTVVTSDRTKSQSNTVTVPGPPPGSSTPPPTAPSSGNGPPPVVQGTPSGVARNSGFSGSSSAPLPLSSADTPTSEAVTPDPGFARGLPYAAGSAPADNGNSSEGDNSAVAVTPGRHSTSNRGILVPVAAGAVLFVGAFHLRILKKRLDEPPSTGLTPAS